MKKPGRSARLTKKIKRQGEVDRTTRQDLLDAVGQHTRNTSPTKGDDDAQP